MEENGPRLLSTDVTPHNTLGDVWVTVFGRVLDVSDLADPGGTLGARTLFAFAGKDISHYFDPDTRDVVTLVHPSSGEEVPVLAPVGEGAWWRETRRLRGRLTERSRPVRILDTLTGTQTHLQVCSEDTVARVLQRYAPFNSAAAERYSCVSEDADDGVVVGLDPARTLEENGVADERDLYVVLGLPEDFYVPALQLIPRPEVIDLGLSRPAGVLG
ncbi:Cytochrome b5 domain-containing protein 1 [Frankliniella fusca]|uniref:Cytochrome b5 domain-containing protein 1 n=1 Tax=Frankliniella fusca TaxID=407009 RepID=A0AAE1HZK7_9NEOP|nr:Cytochrome b5 domain-containing protein 1 [Frankliniella fusca]